MKRGWLRETGLSPPTVPEWGENRWICRILCSCEGRSPVTGFLPSQKHGSVEGRPLDVKSGRLEHLHHLVDRLRIARLALDLDHRVLGREPGENAAVVDLDDIDPGRLKPGGDRGQRAR